MTFQLSDPGSDFPDSPGVVGPIGVDDERILLHRVLEVGGIRFEGRAL